MQAAQSVPVGATSTHLCVADVYRDHADFVWRCLHRLGVRPSDMEDQLQEVFVVVHRNLAKFEGRSALSSWLFGITLRVVQHYRRNLARRREAPLEQAPVPVDTSTPELALVSAQAALQLNEILDGMGLEKRAVFVMFEIEGLSCQEIGDIVGIPLGTVYSRLHAARRSFEKSMRRKRRADKGGKHG